jgi:hypothetical protein
MSFLQDMFDPGTSAYNAKVKAANAKRMSLAMGRNVQYLNKGVAFRSAQRGAVVDKSIADSNVLSKAMQNQYAAFQGFESFARTRAAQSGPTGEGSRTAERGRTANYMALLAKRQDIEHGLRETFGAAYHSQLHQNAVRQQNQQMAARDKLGVSPARMGLAGTKGTNWGNVAFGVGKMAASLYAGGMVPKGGGQSGKEWDWGAAFGALAGVK